MANRTGHPKTNILKYEKLNMVRSNLLVEVNNDIQRISDTTQTKINSVELKQFIKKFEDIVIEVKSPMNKENEFEPCMNPIERRGTVISNESEKEAASNSFMYLRKLVKKLKTIKKSNKQKDEQIVPLQKQNISSKKQFYIKLDKIGIASPKNFSEQLCQIVTQKRKSEKIESVKTLKIIIQNEDCNNNNEEIYFRNNNIKRKTECMKKIRTFQDMENFQKKMNRLKILKFLKEGDTGKNSRKSLQSSTKSTTIVMDQIPEEPLLFELNSSSFDSSSDEDFYNNIETDKYNDDISPESLNLNISNGCFTNYLKTEEDCLQDSSIISNYNLTSSCCSNKILKTISSSRKSYQDEDSLKFLPRVISNITLQSA
jgi:hypothetical protein